MCYKFVWLKTLENPIQPVQNTCENGEVSNDDIDGHIFDCLQDVNEHKDVYRLKVCLLHKCLFSRIGENK